MSSIPSGRSTRSRITDSYGPTRHLLEQQTEDAEVHVAVPVDGAGRGRADHRSRARGVRPPRSCTPPRRRTCASYSGKPDVWLRRWRRVIRPDPAIGRRDAEAGRPGGPAPARPRPSRPASTSCIAAVAVRSLELLATRKRCAGVTASPVAGSATPNAAVWRSARRPGDGDRDGQCPVADQRRLQALVEGGELAGCRPAGRGRSDGLDRDGGGSGRRRGRWSRREPPRWPTDRRR